MWIFNPEDMVIDVRRLSDTIEEWLMSAEYTIDCRNKNLIFFERIIRTF